MKNLSNVPKAVKKCWIRCERIEKPTGNPESDADIPWSPDASAEMMYSLWTDLSKAFDGQTLFSNVSFDIKRGERVALIGK